MGSVSKKDTIAFLALIVSGAWRIADNHCKTPIALDHLDVLGLPRRPTSVTTTIAFDSGPRTTQYGYDLSGKLTNLTLMLHRNSPWILGNAVINEFAEKLLPDLELTRREFLCNSTIAIYYVEITGLSINPCAIKVSFFK